MHAIPEGSVQQRGVRKVLLALDDNRACERALVWVLEQFCRPDDELHLIYVIPSTQRQSYAAPPVDMLPHQQPESQQELEAAAHGFIQSRFLAKIGTLKRPPVVHIEKGAPDTDSIGALICEKAAALPAVAVVIASQGKSRFQQFLLGSTSAFVSKCCRVPVLLVH